MSWCARHCRHTTYIHRANSSCRSVSYTHLDVYKRQVALLVITAAALAAGYAACRKIVESRAGRVVLAIRDAESRTRFLGYPVESFKLWLFVISGILAGVAGALYVPQVGIINPSEFAPINSIEAVIWVAVGGRGTDVYKRQSLRSFLLE